MSYCTYEDSVIAHTDNDLNLSDTLAAKLLADHGFTLEDLDNQNERNAEVLLEWLGYWASGLATDCYSM